MGSMGTVVRSRTATGALGSVIMAASRHREAARRPGLDLPMGGLQDRPDQPLPIRQREALPRRQRRRPAPRRLTAAPRVRSRIPGVMPRVLLDGHHPVPPDAGLTPPEGGAPELPGHAARSGLAATGRRQAGAGHPGV